MAVFQSWENKTLRRNSPRRPKLPTTRASGWPRTTTALPRWRRSAMTSVTSAGMWGRRMWRRWVILYSIDYSVFHKSRQKEFCTDFNTVTVHRNRDLDHLGRNLWEMQGSQTFRTLSRTVLHSSSGSSRGGVWDLRGWVLSATVWRDLQRRKSCFSL